MRARFFGSEASTAGTRERLQASLKNYRARRSGYPGHRADRSLVRPARLRGEGRHSYRRPAVARLGGARSAYRLRVNALGTLNLLEATRQHCPEAVFIFTSTNKVYGDTPNRLPMVELENCYEIDPSHPYHVGIDESMSIDQTKHSLFGASKAAADLLVQEYGRYFGMKTVCFRGGCLTGPAHAGTELHGFLAYLMKCTVAGLPYRVFGYKGKQVRDNIHSYDLVNAFWEFFKAPRSGEVYNIGGGRHSCCSDVAGDRGVRENQRSQIELEYVEDNRVGDHIWWISDVANSKATIRTGATGMICMPSSARFTMPSPSKSLLARLQSRRREPAGAGTPVLRLCSVNPHAVAELPGERVRIQNY